MTTINVSPQRIIIDPDLNDDKMLYRYISLNQFLRFAEAREFSLSRIKEWPDPREVAEARLPVQIDDGPVNPNHWSIYETMYGQCWSKEAGIRRNVENIFSTERWLAYSDER